MLRLQLRDHLKKTQSMNCESERSRKSEKSVSE